MALSVASRAGRARASGARLDLFYDVVSPYSYLLVETLAVLRETWPVTVVLRPFFLGGVMHATSNQPPGNNPVKAQYMMQDLARQADYFGLPFAAPVAFPINTINVQRLLNALDVHTGGSGQSPQLWSASLALFRAYWANSKDIADVAVQRQALCPGILDAALFDRLVNVDAKLDLIKARLKANSDEAVAHGAYGAPTVLLQRADETEPTMYFGADRLHLIARHLGVSMPASFPARSRL